MVKCAPDIFCAQLQALYQGTRKWGTVRLLLKRSFTENFHFKKSKLKERRQDRQNQSADPDAKFALQVKAATPKKRLSTIVASEEAKEFESKLTAIMTQAMFKNVPVQQQRKGKKVPQKPTDARQVGKSDKSKTAIKKSRKERRRDLKKA